MCFDSLVSLLCDVPTVLALVVNDVVSAEAVVIVVAEDPVRLAPITALSRRVTLETMASRHLQ